MPGRVVRRILALILCIAGLTACAGSPAAPAATPTPRLDAETRALVDKADRVVFVVPFSHWDTDWHETYPAYVQRSDGNILAALAMAKQDPRFRYTLEQVLFVQHFWDAHPEARADLQTAVKSRQITFAWGGIIQPETSLVAPVVQVRNLQLGEDWIASTFGSEFVPHLAWQSDAFGNSAAFPVFLEQAHIPYLFIGRGQARCDPTFQNCQTLPYAFYWTSPLGQGRVLTAYLSYPTAWDGIHMLPDEDAQLASLHKIVDSQFRRTTGKYLLLPMGSDFIDPLPNVMSLVDKWNRQDSQTALVVSDPETAFQYLATQKLPEITVDMNPVWQAFYATRPEAKVADKVSAYYLAAQDKFGMLTDAPLSAAWQLAAINAHYDNIGAVSFDNVWESTQRPRFEQAVETAASDLASTLGRIVRGMDSPRSAAPAPVVVFNPTSWQRSEVVELADTLPATSQIPPPVQPLAPHSIAFLSGPVPSIGYASLSREDRPIQNPTSVTRSGTTLTLSNGLVEVTLDAAHGGALSSVKSLGYEYLSGWGDDVTFIADRGDVYGAFFGATRARESDLSARVQVLAEGPLLARVEDVFSVEGVPITKTLTLTANSPRVDVTLDIRALPDTTALAQTATTLDAAARTDDLGFAAFEHPVDTRPIAAGDVTYRRQIFYPVIYWSDVTAGPHGLTLLTQGLQGIAGARNLSFMLVRSVTERNEGVTDLEYHTLRYAYLPHASITVEDLSRRAYEFNQPLIPAWSTPDRVFVALPFEPRARSFPADALKGTTTFPPSHSLLSAEGGIVADLFHRQGGVQALVIDPVPATAVSIRGARTSPLAKEHILFVPVELQ